MNVQSDVDTNRQMTGGFIGGIKGALIGLAVGGPIGAIVGAKLGIVVGMALKEGVAYIPCGVLPCDFELGNNS
jgi:outer membrane lipoprotein SlyB